MSALAPAEAHVLSTVPGRLRVHVSAWSGSGQRNLEAQIRAIDGVRSAAANPLTRNVLIRFDLDHISEAALIAAIEALDPNASAAEPPSTVPLAIVEPDGALQRARITVRGLDRNPSLAHSIVETLRRRIGVVHVRTSPLTGRVLIEFNQQEVDLDDLLNDVAHIELPELPGEDRPAHPLDPGPLLQSSARSIGSGLGLTLLAVRQLTGFRIAPGSESSALRASATITILQGFPFVRHGLRRLLGRDVADLLIYVPTIISLTLAGSPLGLAVTGAEALRLLTEIVPRRKAWRAYEERLHGVAAAEPDTLIRVEAGERVPMGGTVVEGTGTALARNGLPASLAPGQEVDAGARLFGGPFVIRLQAGPSFVPRHRSTPIAPTLHSRYIRALGPVSLGYATLTAVLTRSVGRTLTALLLVSPRTAVIGLEAADVGASARVLRAGVTAIGSRRARTVRLPGSLLIDSGRVLAEGFEISSIVRMNDAYSAPDVTKLAAALAAGTGSPWGSALSSSEPSLQTVNASFDGSTASSVIGDVHYHLGSLSDDDRVPVDVRLRFRGEHVLALRSERETTPLALFILRPKLAAGVKDVVDVCNSHGVELALLASEHSLPEQVLARRAGISVVLDGDALNAIRERQSKGGVVAFVSDSADAGAAFAACDLAIGLTSGRRGRFPARADLLAPDVNAVAAIIDAGARRESAIRDAAVLSSVANVFGAVYGLRSAPGIHRASQGVYVTALVALADGWARLRGGERPWTALAHLVDPNPEQWGRRDIAGVLRSLSTTDKGLTSAQALRRRQRQASRVRGNRFAGAMLTQLRSPLTGVLAAGAGLSLVLRASADVAMIGLTIVANALVGAWQERQAGQAVEALERIGSTNARVLRDGLPTTIPASEVVPGDVLILASGERVAADARIINASSLEVDEAALTGESMPVAKAATGGTDAGRIVLAGCDVTVGTGYAVVFAVGRRTRLGATAAALDIDETRHSPLGIRLNRMLRQVLPLAGIGGLIVFASGALRGQAVLQQLAIGAAIAIAAVPEGLPLLAGMGEAGVARRLAGRGALVRRLAAVEALGRVDVACSDKTGTLTQGRLALSMIASMDRDAAPDKNLSDDLRNVIIAAGIATPHPEALGAGAHPTDVAVIRGAERAGLTDEVRVDREEESPFDPARPFHAARANGRVYVKGAVEALLPRCGQVLRGGDVRRLSTQGRTSILARATKLADHGLRILMVARGPMETETSDPNALVALGFIGISDPLRPGVPAAVSRCREAGVRVVMLTGDHPATARAIGREAGLLDTGGEVLTGADIAELHDSALDRRLEQATVIARVTPLDKLRIVESLQRHGHTVAMTGDGVNDGPALRLADVGVAMGRGGTEVARQAADVVLADDDFSTLVETLVEGRSFWRNIRRALALLLGGNLGELGLMVGASVLGTASPLLTRQILAVNLITDALPALAVALQPPESRKLTELAREGTAALDVPLRNDVLRRGFATAAPSIAAYLLALPAIGLAQARSVAFGSIVATQLAQTLDAGRSEGALTRSVFGAVAGSAGVLVAAFTVPPLQAFLSLATPAPLGWALIGGCSMAAMVLGRLFTLSTSAHLPTLHAPPGLSLLTPRPRRPALLPAP